MKVTECTARTLRQGDAISELEAQGEDLEVAMAKAERALEGIGVSIRGETADSLRDIEDIIGDVAGAWDTLSDSQKQAVSEAMAGTQRSSMFSALIENYDQVLKLQKEGLNSFGELAEANQKRVESFEGQLNILKDKMLAFTDGLQPLIFGSVELGNNLLDLVNSFGAIPTVVGLASASFLSFSNSGQQLKTTLLEMVGSKIKLVDGINQIISAQNKMVESSKNEVAITQQQISSTIKKIAQLRLEHSAQNDKTKDIYKEQQALVGLNKELVNNQKQLALATLKATAFQAVLSLGMSFAISGAIALLQKLVFETGETSSAIDNISEKFEELNNSFKETNNEVSSLEKMVKEYEKLESQLNSTSKNSEEYKIAEENLLAIQKELAQLYPSLVSYVDDEGNAYANNKTNIDAYVNSKKEELETQKELLKLEAQANKHVLEDEVKDKKQQMEEMKESMEYNANLIEEINKRIESGQEKWSDKWDLGVLSKRQNELIKSYEETGNSVKQAEDKIKSYNEVLGETNAQEVNDKIQGTLDKINSLNDTLNNQDSSSGLSSSVNSLVEDLEKFEEGSDEAKQTLEKLKSTFEDMPDDVDTLADAIDYLNGKLEETSESADMKDLNESYLEAMEDIEEAKKLLDSFKEGLDVSELRNIFDSELMKDFNGSITDTVAVQEHLNNKIAEMGEIADQAYIDMNRSSEEFWNNQVKNSEQWANFEKQAQQDITTVVAEQLGIQADDFSNYIQEKGGLRDVDLSNANNLAEAEKTLNQSYLGQLLGWYGKYVNDKADARGTDMNNIANFLNEQGDIEIKTINQLIDAWNNYYNKKKKEVAQAINQLTSIGGAMYRELTDLEKNNVQIYDKYDMGNYSAEVNNTLGSYQKTLKELEKANQQMQTFFEGGYATFNGVSGSGLGQSKVNTGGGSSGSSSNKGSSGGKGSSSSSSKNTEKEVEDLDLKIDKYQELEEAINRVDEALSRNQEAQRMVSTKAELKKLLEEEIKLMEKKQKAIGDLRKEIQKEQQDLKKQLEKSGLKFDGDELVGDKVTGGSVADRLQDAQKWANSAKGAEKEWRKNDVLYLQESIERYYELMNQLGDVNSQYNDMAYEIRQAKKEQEELLKAVENLADRYLKVTMKEKALNNELSLNRRKQEYAIGEELLKLRERELEILQQQKKVNGDKIAELKEEKEELKQVLIKGGFQFDKDGLISNYEKLWESATAKYNTLAGYEAEEYKEYLDELADSIDRYLEIVNDELPEAEEYYYDIADALKEIEDQQKEWAKQLEEVMDLFDRLHDTTNKLSKAENELALIESQLSVAQGDEKIALLKRQEELYKAQQKLMKEKLSIQKEQAKEMQAELGNLGVTFDTDGFVSNYESLVKKMQQQIEAMPGGTARDEAIEELEELLAKIEEYEDLVNNEIPSTEQTWWDLNASIKDAQREQLQIVEDVQSSIANAIKNKWQENTQALQDEIDKQKDMLNKQWKEEDWEDSLGKAEMELNKLQAQINNLSKDTSLAGQLKLEQLKEQYKEQLEAINDMIKDHEREQANQMLEDEKDKLTEEMEDALTAENLANAVNNALATGMVKIGDEYMSLNDLMLDSIAQQEEAYFALGDVIRDEMISSLKEASALLKDIESISKSLTSNSLATSSYLGNTHSNSVENINSRYSSVLENNNSPLVSIVMKGSGLDGNVTMKDVNKAVNKGIDECLVRLEKLMR